MQDYFAEQRAFRRKEKLAQMRRAVAVAQEVGTRAAARRLGLDPDTISQWLQATGAKPVQPVSMEVSIELGPGGVRLTARGKVRRYVGKQPETVAFEAVAIAADVGAALDQVLAHVRAVAGRRHAWADAGTTKPAPT